MTQHHRRFDKLLAALVVLALAALDAKAAGEGQICGGISGIACSAGLWCALPDGLCGGKDVQGACVRIGTVCIMDYRPVCGCDGRTYGNDCQLRVARVQKKTDGPCR